MEFQTTINKYQLYFTARKLYYIDSSGTEITKNVMFKT